MLLTNVPALIKLISKRSKLNLLHAKIMVDNAITVDDVGEFEDNTYRNKSSRQRNKVPFCTKELGTFLAPRFVMPIQSISGAVSG